jgi:Rod binding domain-containing protein
MIGVATTSGNAALLSARRGPDMAQRVAASKASNDDSRMRQLSQQLVGEAFYGLLMKEMRKSVSNDHLLSGGVGEDILGPYLDQQLVQRMAESRGFALADAVYESINRTSAGAPPRPASRATSQTREAQ